MEKNKKIMLTIIILIILGIFYYFFRYWFGTKHNLVREDDYQLRETSLSNINPLTDTCENKYQTLLNVNGFDFNKHCFKDIIIKDKNSLDLNGNSIEKEKINLIVIFDASGSMRSRVGGVRKIDIAKKAAKKFIGEVSKDKEVSLSILAYGHRGTNQEKDKAYSCNAVEEIYSLSDRNPKIINSRIDSLKARGWTPIDKSLKIAKKMLIGKNNDENIILLISDGKEKCDGDPVKTLREIKSEGRIRVVVDVIGFDVGGAEEKQLELIAEAGNGQYLKAKNAVGLKKAFDEKKRRLDELNYEKNKTADQVYNMSFLVNNYNQCKIALEEERAIMKIDINANKFSGKDCLHYANTTYDSRYSEIRKSIENTFLNNKEKLDRLK